MGQFTFSGTILVGVVLLHACSSSSTVEVLEPRESRLCRCLPPLDAPTGIRVETEGNAPLTIAIDGETVTPEELAQRTTVTGRYWLEIDGGADPVPITFERRMDVTYGCVHQIQVDEDRVDLTLDCHDEVAVMQSVPYLETAEAQPSIGEVETTSPEEARHFVAARLADSYTLTNQLELSLSAAQALPNRLLAEHIAESLGEIQLLQSVLHRFEDSDLLDQEERVVALTAGHLVLRNLWQIPHTIRNFVSIDCECREWSPQATEAERIQMSLRYLPPELRLFTIESVTYSLDGMSIMEREGERHDLLGQVNEVYGLVSPGSHVLQADFLVRAQFLTPYTAQAWHIVARYSFCAENSGPVRIDSQLLNAPPEPMTVRFEMRQESRPTADTL